MRFAVIGCGMIAGIHTNAIRTLPQAQPVGAANNNLQNLHTFCEKYAIMPYETTGTLRADAVESKKAVQIIQGTYQAFARYSAEADK